MWLGDRLSDLLVWLFATYGDLALPILIGAQVGMLVLDASTFMLAALVSPKVKALRLAPYVPVTAFSTAS